MYTAKDTTIYALCFACGAAFGVFVAALMQAANGD